MSTHLSRSSEDSAPAVPTARVESWRWHLDSPDEVGRLARLLTRQDRMVESVSVGNSMGSTLPPGTPMRFHCGPSRPEIGEVIVFLAGPEDLIAHRVVARGWGPRGRRYLVTRGDNSVLCDQPVRADAVLGLVKECRRDGTWLPLGPRPRRSIPVTITAGVLRVLMLGALTISPRLAIFVAAGSYRVVQRLSGLLPGRRFQQP